MKPHFHLSTTALLLILVARSAAAQDQYVIEPLGAELIDRDVYALAWNGADVFAAADTNGIFVYAEEGSGSPAWKYIGLGGVNCREIAVDPTNPRVILVGTLPFGFGRAVLFRSTNGGSTWTTSDEGITQEERVPGRALPGKARIRIHPNDPARVVVTGVAFSPHYSSDSGKTWQKLGGDAWGSATINDVVWSLDHPGVMFAGGEGLGLSPLLYRSTDWGESWSSVLDIPADSFQGENAIDGIAICPTNPGVVVAGTEGYIVRTTDNGNHWQKVIDERLPYYMTSPAWDWHSNERIFMVGGNALTGGNGIVLVSNNYGATWEVVARDEWCTVERAIASPYYPNSLIFSAARAKDFPGQDALPRGVFILRPYQSNGISQRPESWRCRLWLE